MWSKICKAGNSCSDILTCCQAFQWGVLYTQCENTCESACFWKAEKEASRIMLEELFKSSTSVLLLGVIIGLLIIQILLSSFSSKERREPPGPKPLLLLGNLLQVDLKRLDKSLFDVRNSLLTVLWLCWFCQCYLGLWVSPMCTWFLFSFLKDMDQCLQSTLD